MHVSNLTFYTLITHLEISVAVSYTNNTLKTQSKKL